MTSEAARMRIKNLAAFLLIFLWGVYNHDLMPWVTLAGQVVRQTFFSW